MVHSLDDLILCEEDITDVPIVGKCVREQFLGVIFLMLRLAKYRGVLVGQNLCHHPGIGYQ